MLLKDISLRLCVFALIFFNQLTPLISLPPTLQIRPMIEADIEGVLAIERLSLPTVWSAKGYEREITENKLAHYYVLTHDDLVIGYCGHWLIGDELHVSIIAVHPQWRGRHLGECLLLYMLLTAYEQAAMVATLEVRQHSHIAQSLYDKYRFKRLGERPRYYKDTGENAVIMTVEPLDNSYYDFLQTQREALEKQLNYEFPD